jgi:hypothetical protein
MPIVVKHTGQMEAELVKDGSLRGTASDEYTIFGAANAIAAIEGLATWLAAEGLDVIGSMQLRGIKAKTTRGRVSDGTFAVICDVNWATFEARETERAEGVEADPSEEEWDLGSESVRLYLPLSVTVHRPTGLPSPIASPAIKLIGDKADGEQPEGVDWLSPTVSFTIPQVLPVSVVDYDLLEAFEGVLGKLNASTFRGRPAECVQYLGASARRRGTGQVVFSHRFFSRRPKVIEVDGFDDIELPGFDYAWPIPQATEEDGKVTREPGFIASAKIGYTANFGIFEG